MYKVFDSIVQLYAEIEADKNWTGAESSFRNRYPLRFVLFENFRDFNEFIQECSNHNVYVQSMERWMADGSDDKLITYSQLALRFEEYIKSIPANDFVIAPFSEITRFYDNKKFPEFDSLLKTIRLIQSLEDAQQDHQRIYVPIIGMQQKIGQFINDPNIHIWEYRSGIESKNYKLILSRGTTYGVQGLEDCFTICHNLREWIALWKIGGKVKPNIICSSKAIFDNATNAQPDNAFDYEEPCYNAYLFLTKGLRFDFGELEYNEEDSAHWERLATEVDYRDFDFDSYVCKHFNTLVLNDGCDFVHAWFENQDEYSRWLLRMYYVKNQKDNYLKRVLKACTTCSSTELFSAFVTQIFDEAYDEIAIRQRYKILSETTKHQITITELAERKMSAKLEAIAVDPNRGYYYALRYFTPLTASEKLLLIKWIGIGKIVREDVKATFPALYHYLTPFALQQTDNNQWVNEYFTEYCKSKIAKQPTERLSSIINEKNASPALFETWRNNFKTVKTLLSGREDIDVFYWIDGLGVDWIPFITKIIERHNVDGVFLNEIHIASAELPTCTENNKIKLEGLSPNGLEKIGDLDTFAHSQKKHPDYLLVELKKIEEAVSKVLAQYNGKKIAFVSDHGISYLANTASGLNLAGIDTNHAGRCGVWKNGTARGDNKYFVIDDGKTICSLTHSSLTSKTPDGQGAHGGATPEEVLVPVIIVSSQKNANTYSAKLIDNEIMATSPTIRYRIKGLSSIDRPVVVYNGVEYSLHRKDGNDFESEKLNLVDTETKVTLIIGNYKQTDSLIIKTGVDEDDLFGGF